MAFPRSSALLAPLALAALALAGCDPSVQARYRPTSVDEVFGPFSGVIGVDDPEVYELPGPPPALGAVDIDGRACTPPGVKLWRHGIVALREEDIRQRRLEPTPLVAEFEPPLPSPPPMPAHRIASWQLHDEPGVKEPIGTPYWTPTAEAGRSIHRNDPTLDVAYRRDIWSWCHPAANQRVR